ncbi:MAG: hypothetical protein HND47_04505 [Chloroflexi bacterium]|nr:hypothetical protein [Chloroflexota bacterium]
MTALAVLLLAAVLLAALTVIKRKSPARLREIPAFTRLVRTVGLSIEDGKRLHISLGHGGLLDARAGSAFAGLAILRIVAERTSVSDMPSVASAGGPDAWSIDPGHDQAGYQAANVDELYVPTTGRVTGLTPFSYAAGAMHIAPNESVSTNILTGHFGPEAGLLAEASDRDHVTLIGASDNLDGQAVLYVSSQDALIGEELFAAGAYLGGDPAHTASLALQDILRWLVILALLGGAALKFVGVL